jgi:hypothetical protein
MMVERHLRDPRFGKDSVDADRMETMAVEQAKRRID